MSSGRPPVPGPPVAGWSRVQWPADPGPDASRSRLPGGTRCAVVGPPAGVCGCCGDADILWVLLQP